MRTKTVSSFFYSLAFLVTFGTTAVSSAQERHMGGAEITVFADPNFRGKAQTLFETYPISQATVSVSRSRA